MNEDADDIQRLARTWTDSLLNEWLAPPPASAWIRNVNDDRIVNQDRIRPFVTRGALLAAMTSLLFIGSDPRWTWCLLGLGVVQTIAEIAYEPVVRAKHEAVAHQLARGQWLIRAWYWNYQHGITNITGVLGLVACVANLWVVMFASGPADARVGAKVAALACAILYTVSGALGPLLDNAAYDRTALIPPKMWVVLRFMWIAVGIAIAAAIVLSERTNDAWGDSLPYALMTCSLAYYPMLRIREFERTAAAARSVASTEEAEHNIVVGRDLHTLLQPVKATLHRAAAALTDPRDRAEVRQFISDLEYVHQAARERRINGREGLIRPLDVQLKNVADNGLVRLDAQVNLPATIDDKDFRLAKQTLLTLLENSVQAYAIWDGESTARIRVAAHVDDEERVAIEVDDQLPLIPDDIWNGRGKTLAGVRSDIESLGGTMIQLAHYDGKRIVATWPTRRAVRTYEARAKDHT